LLKAENTFVFLPPQMVCRVPFAPVLTAPRAVGWQFADDFSPPLCKFDTPRPPLMTNPLFCLLYSDIGVDLLVPARLPVLNGGKIPFRRFIFKGCPLFFSGWPSPPRLTLGHLDLGWSPSVFVR